eukprot:744981-Hanusia_phi.AAC.1
MTRTVSATREEQKSRLSRTRDRGKLTTLPGGHPGPPHRQSRSSETPHHATTIPPGGPQRN